jgi:hypothetical protein
MVEDSFSANFTLQSSKWYNSRGDYILFSFIFTCKNNQIKILWNIKKSNRNRFQSTGFGLVQLFYIKNWNPTDRFRLCSVWFGYFILKTKNYIVFWVFFFYFLMDLVSVWFGLVLTKPVWLRIFYFRLMKPKPNRVRYFKKIF